MTASDKMMIASDASASDIEGGSEPPTQRLPGRSWGAGLVGFLASLRWNMGRARAFTAASVTEPMVEVTSVTTRTPLISPAANRVISEFYAEQVAYANQRRLQLEQAHVAASQVRRRCDESAYLDESRLAAAQEASRAYLARHPAWWRPLCADEPLLDAIDLRRRVALQHFLDQDIADLDPQSGSPLDDDDFVPSSGSRGNLPGDVSKQLLLDVTRGIYVVDGVQYHFADELEASGISLEEAPDQVEALKEDFQERVVAAIRRCLSGPSEEFPPPRLVRAVTRAMSQVGLAGLEKACSREGPDVVVSGGDQEIRVDLTRGGASEDDEQPARGARSWRLAFGVEKTDFERVMVFDGDDTELIECPARGSRLARHAVVRVSCPSASACSTEPFLVRARRGAGCAVAGVFP